MKFLKFISVLFVTVIIVGQIHYETAAIDVNAQAAILMCADNGEVLFALNENKQLPMASTTKIMTALLLIEQGTPFREIKVTHQMVSIEGTSMGLLPGDTVSFDALAHGMLLSSGNDAANTAALTIGTSAEDFASLMNNRAIEIGMKNTLFVTASGLDSEGHCSTAFDMALLACEALENPVFRSICGKKSAIMSYGNPPYERTLTNHNRLLWSYPSTIGIKTGFTKKSGRCLVSAAERYGITLICVTLNDPDDWNDHINLFEYGFSQLKEKVLDTENPTLELSVVGGVKSSVSVDVINEEVIFSDLPVKSKVYLRPFEYAPVMKGKIVGFIEYSDNNGVCGRNSLVTSEQIAADVFAENNNIEPENNLIKRFINRIKSSIKDYLTAI